MTSHFNSAHLSKHLVENGGTANEKVPNRNTLRLGIVLDSYQVPAWVCYLLRKLSNASLVDLCLVALDESRKTAAKKNRPPLLFRLWMAFDRRIRRPASDALKSEDCRELLNNGQHWNPSVVRTNLSSPTSNDLALLKEARLDLLLHLGSGELSKQLAECAQSGIWLLQDSDLRDASEVPGQFWDIYDGIPVITRGPRVVECIGNCTRVLYRSRGITNMLSLVRNQNAAWWNLAEFLVGKLSRGRAVRERAAKFRAAHAPRQKAHTRTLGSIRMASFLMRLALRTLHHEFNKCFFEEQWRIVVQAADKDKLLPTASGTFFCIDPPRDRFYADPFVIERSGRTYIFFEDYRFATKKGLISCCEVDDSGNYSKPTVVLARDYHLSYPFLFEWQGEIYLLPETRENRTIEIYRATDFPFSWECETVLMKDVAATDSTLFQHQGKWWLFTSGVKDQTTPNEELFLYFADSPLGSWTPHPKNPIVSDPRRARPAGNLYFKNGKLIRPGQDCSKGYGYAIQLNQVNVLSETDYWETPLARITPEWVSGSRGIHTFNQGEKRQVMDAKFRISRFHLAHLALTNKRLFREINASLNLRPETNKSLNMFAREPGKKSR